MHGHHAVSIRDIEIQSGIRQEMLACLRTWNDAVTATERARSRLPKSSKILITAEMSTIAQKLLMRQK